MGITTLVVAFKIIFNNDNPNLTLRDNPILTPLDYLKGTPPSPGGWGSARSSNQFFCFSKILSA